MSKDEERFVLVIFVVVFLVDFITNLYNDYVLEHTRKFEQNTPSKVIEINEKLHEFPRLREDSQEDEVAIKLTQEEFETLCITVYAEAGEESGEVQQMVAETILHRIQSEDFPNTLMGVLKEKNQFKVVSQNGTVVFGKGEFAKELTFSDCTKTTIGAVANAISGNRPLTEEDILYFAQDPETGCTVFSTEPML